VPVLESVVRSNSHIKLSVAGRLIGWSLSTTQRRARAGDLGPIAGTYPSRVALRAVEAITGPITEERLERARVGRKRRRQVRHG
jgi:hypothetical protein